RDGLFSRQTLDRFLLGIAEGRNRTGPVRQRLGRPGRGPSHLIDRSAFPDDEDEAAKVWLPPDESSEGSRHLDPRLLRDVLRVTGAAGPEVGEERGLKLAVQGREGPLLAAASGLENLRKAIAKAHRRKSVSATRDRPMKCRNERSVDSAGGLRRP